jgi:hypothetical protein
LPWEHKTLNSIAAMWHLLNEFIFFKLVGSTVQSNENVFYSLGSKFKCHNEWRRLFFAVDWSRILQYMVMNGYSTAAECCCNTVNQFAKTCLWYNFPVNKLIQLTFCWVLKLSPAILKLQQCLGMLKMWKLCHGTHIWHHECLLLWA